MVAPQIASADPATVFATVTQWAQYGVTWGLQGGLLVIGVLIAASVTTFVFRIIFTE